MHIDNVSIHSFFQGIVKQMSNGVNATEILRGIIKPQHNEDVIQTAIKMASLPSAVKAGGSVAGAGATSEAKSSSSSSNGGTSSKNDKCPLLMELLYKSFQARLAKENRLKALQQIEHQHHHEKSSSLKPNHSSAAISALVAALPVQVPTSSVQAVAALAPSGGVTANQTMAATSHTSTTNPMEAAVNPFPMSSPELLAALNQQQQQPPPPPPPCAQPPMASYPLFSYYMNPMWASAAQYFQHPHQSLMIPNVMQLGPLTSQVAATAGIKRAAAPVIYPNSGHTIEKRMKLA